MAANYRKPPPADGPTLRSARMLFGTGDLEMSPRSKVTRFLAVVATGASLLLLGRIGVAAPGDKAKGQGAKPAVKVPPVSDVRMDQAGLSSYIDKAIAERLKEEGVTASPLASDAEFLRRVYLDITGHIPSAEKAAAFLDDKSPNKRAKLIDELLASEDYGKHLADIWQTLLIPKNSDNRRLNAAPMGQWLEENFNKNRPWDQMVHDLITATGAQDKNGATTFYIANATADKMTDEVTKVFLGVQLQCAQCHNHPFTAWKQTEYWGMAAFFTKVQTTRPQAAARQGTPPTVQETDRPRRGRAGLPESAKIVPPKFLGGAEPSVTASAPYRPVLADWLTTAQNPYFSKAMANRIWGQYLGRGLVNPVDDMNDDNPASHPELLQELANQFAKNGFDVKYLVRAICNSHAYQRSSKPAGGNVDAAPNLYAHMAVKVLTPEQMFDSLGNVLGKPEGRPADGRRPMGRPGPNGGSRAAFVAFFGIDDTVSVTEYQVGIPQALNLMNSPRINNAVQNNAIVRSSKPPTEVIDGLYLATVARRPTAHERERLTTYVKKSGEPTQAYADILWALLNSSEFTLNH
jgi:hypothetical protein